MTTVSSPAWRRHARSGVVLLGATAASAAVGLSASTAPSSAASGEQAFPRAGTCAGGNYSNANYLGKYGGKQSTLIQAGGQASEPEFSLDGRANKRLAFVSTGAVTGGARAGVKNVFVVSRTGSITRNGNAWQKGGTSLISQGVGGPADGDSYAPSLSGYTGRGDAPKGPAKIAFLSKATNLPGGNPTGVSAYVANSAGGGVRRLNVPGTATGVGISGDSKIVYVTTDSGIYLVRGSGAGKKLASGAGMNSPSTTLNGKQAAFGQGGSIYTITAKGARKRITTGTDPQADGGFPNGGSKQGLVRAISYNIGGSAYKFGIIAKSSAKRGKRLGSTSTPTSINGGGSAVAFGNGEYACLQVQVLETGKRGGYGIPQGKCPAGTGRVTDVGVSTRYNYLAFTCGGGVYLYYVGGK